MRYKVIDRHTIQEISNEEVLPPNISDYEISHSANREKSFLNKYYDFIPIEQLPSSNCWLKEEKWFWCNEEDWKSYMDSIKTKE